MGRKQPSRKIVKRPSFPHVFLVIITEVVEEDRTRKSKGYKERSEQVVLSKGA